MHKTAADCETLRHDYQGRIVPDPHRPGPGRVRLQPESIAVWAIVGYTKAIAGGDDLGDIDDAVVRRVAHDYDISESAVRAALAWYACQPMYIDAILAENAAAFA